MTQDSNPVRSDQEFPRNDGIFAIEGFPDLGEGRAAIAWITKLEGRAKNVLDVFACWRVLPYNKK